MPRNGSGIYSLPSGNPVVAGATIEAAWANTTLTDVANELTNSLSRDGNGGMLAPFRVADGSVSVPGLAFTNETNTGLYRAGSGEMWLTVGGIAVAQVTVNGLLVPSGKRITLPAPVNTTDAANKVYVDTLVAPVIAYADYYLGAKSSDPTTNNSGGALTTGTTYWSTSLNQMRVYNGTNWVPMLTISSLVGQTFSGTGAQTAFTLANPTGNAINLEVFISGVRQVPTTDYSVSGTTLTFVAAPPSGSANIFVRYAQLGTITDGAGSIVYTPAGTGAVATTVQTKLRESVSVKDFGAKGDGVTDDTAALQAAITASWKSGKILLLPAGIYLISSTLNIPPGSGYEYRADSFTMEGEGAGSGFLGYNLSHGTTIITNTNVPVLTYTNYTSNGNNIFIDKIRFQQNNAAATSDVLYFQIFNSWSVISNCEVFQAGLGHGIHMEYAYGGTIKDTVVMNKDLVDATPGLVRIGTAVKIDNTGSGGLLLLQRVSARGFLRGYNFISAAGSNISARMEQCECSTLTYGINTGTSMKKLVISTCYFEGVTGTCISDTAFATTIENCFFFEGYALGISSITNNYGSRYVGNVFQLNSANCTAINIQSDGDALGVGKVVAENFFYFLGSGGSLASVVGVTYTGTNPNITIKDNIFRPRRSWVGGVGTKQIQDNSTGNLVGARPIDDTFSQFQVYSNIGLSLSYTGNTVTSANVSAGVLTLPVDSRFDVSMLTAGNITAISLGTGVSRIVVLNILASNVAVLTKGTYMLLSANFPTLTAGALVLDVRVVGANTYAYELSRTLY